jgi:hypothetical protein
MFVDASLVVRNAGGQRRCETQVGQRYGYAKVSANSTNLASPRLAGVRLLRLPARVLRDATAYLSSAVPNAARKAGDPAGPRASPSAAATYTCSYSLSVGSASIRASIPSASSRDTATASAASNRSARSA